MVPWGIIYKFVYLIVSKKYFVLLRKFIIWFDSRIFRDYPEGYHFPHCVIVRGLQIVTNSNISNQILAEGVLVFNNLLYDNEWLLIIEDVHAITRGHNWIELWSNIILNSIKDIYRIRVG